MKKDCGQIWWREAKYGMFIHWGLYAVLAGTYQGRETPGIGEWIMKRLDIPVAEYEKLAAQFNPTGFDAKAWAQLASDAGMKYLVITAKHHDGFAMYHSKVSKYNIVDATPFGRDPMAELAEACRIHDIKLCFYYSQAQDWHDPDGYGYGPILDKDKNFRRYLNEKCKPQLTELLTQYGDIGLIWFDTPMIMTPEESLELKQHVKSIQPDCIVSGRVGNQLGEYMSTGDNRIPMLPFDGDWEVPATLNDTWGFKTNDINWKKPIDLLRLLLKINSRGGNYLLNVGPDARGVIPGASADILRDLGTYVKANNNAIYSTKAVMGYPYELENIYLTRRDHHLYIHDLSGKAITTLPMLRSEVMGVKMLSTGEVIQPLGGWQLSLNAPATPVQLGRVFDVEIADAEPVFLSLDEL